MLQFLFISLSESFTRVSSLFVGTLNAFMSPMVVSLVLDFAYNFIEKKYINKGLITRNIEVLSNLRHYHGAKT